MRLLLIEDDPQMQLTLQRALTRRHFVVQSCGDAVGAWRAWQKDNPDLVLLDLSLPDSDGLELLQQARQAGLKTPVIILTARGTVGDRVLGLNIGADDYMLKPFDLDELEARILALLRRHGASQEASQNPAFGELVLDRKSGAVYCQGRLLDLPPRELAMLRTLLQRPGQAVSKAQVMGAVFGEEAPLQPDAVDVVAYRLRRKLQDTRVNLVTLRGLGYVLRPAT